MKNSRHWTEPESNNPIEGFRQCHAGIIAQVEALRGLRALYLEPDPSAASRVAHGFVEFFSEAVLPHHDEEERELFPSVLRHAADGDEKSLVTTLVRRLTDEHRDLEARWKKLLPEMKRLAKGKDADIDVLALEAFADAYVAHAQFEEAAFLPLSQKVLGPHGLEGLGLQIHARHVLERMPAYI